MKKIFLKLICVFAFILCFVVGAFAKDLNITSVVYDNSNAFLTINSKDSDAYTFQEVPKLYIDQDQHKAYFDIKSANLRASSQDLILNSGGIKEIWVKQFSTDPNIVRVVINYSDNYNPRNIQLKRLGETLFVRFNTAQIQNYYFQHVYTDTASVVQNFVEPTVIQVPLPTSTNDILKQINSAFQLGTTENKNYVLTKKDLVLSSKYYIDNVTIKNGTALINGIGAITLTKPFVLSNPTRIVYDIPNTIVNPSIHNKEFYISQTEQIKIGQFDKSTARIVLTSKYADKYVAVISPDGQNLEFVDNVIGKKSTINMPKAAFTSLKDELIDKNTYNLKLVFSKPVVYGLDRNFNALDLYLYNVDKYSDVNLKSSVALENIKLSSMLGGGTKFSLPLMRGDIIDIHAGNDGKTIRIKLKVSESVEGSKKAENTEINVPSVVVPARVNRAKKLIVVDAGHGGTDCGATRNNIYEKDIVLDISKRVQNLLAKKGYEVVMTRDTDVYLSLQERVDISEAVDPDIFVSIHVNSSNSETPNGIETHYYKDNSLQLAKIVHASMLNHVKAHNRGLFKSKFYVINHTTAPAILVEIGFISNTNERGQLVTESRKQATAKAIAEGIYEYFKQ